jgi:hypothetical protein
MISLWSELTQYLATCCWQQNLICCVWFAIMLLSCFSDGLSQETAAVILVFKSSASRDAANLSGQFWEVAVGPSLEALWRDLSSKF